MPAEMLVASRFEIESEAGSGGMGRVFAACDRKDGTRVALKLVGGQSASELERFMREASALAELRHPAIVRHVAHGTTASGDPYLAMQWLEGHDLAARLAAEGVTEAEALAVVLRIAGALAAAHARGIVHRDVKPSNIFLVNGKIEEATLIDFGVAQFESVGHEAPRKGVTVGTPRYMSPEQARGDRLDARADIYSLGCVLYECLTGKSLFQGSHAIALLAKILMATPPRVSETLPGVSEELDLLVAQMLAKEPADRPADASAVVQAIGVLTKAKPPPTPPAREARPRALTAAEQRLVCVVLASPSPLPSSIDAGDTLRPEEIHAVPKEARAAIARSGSDLHVLADGSMLVTPAPGGSAADQAWQAARSALALELVLPGASISIATARGTAQGELPAFEVIDRAAQMLLVERQRPGVRIDESTAALLGDRFDVEQGEGGTRLVGERTAEGRTPTLLGRPTLCVGRERELSTLLGLYEQCAEEAVARVAVVVAAAGIGKSRVRHELLRRLAQRGAPEAWMARGDPMSAGSPFGMLGQALRRAAGIQGGEPLEDRRAKLRARVSRSVAAKDRTRIAEFLGEMVGAPFDDADDEPLRAARRDAILMNDQISRAFQDFVESECRAHPVVIVFEDLHWGDAPSVLLVDAALGHVRGGPLFVLALARPEVRGLFPHLWVERGVLELSLAELTRSASEKLVRGVLGKGADAAAIARIVERGGGNAFYLEELIRAVAEDGGDAMPETVLAMAESRLQRLDGEARRVLRAASVLGTVFWRGGAVALLGGDALASEVGKNLDLLVHREVISRNRESKLQGEHEYSFRHALLRDAAYAMLTEEDKKLGHQLAGEWLEAVGAPDAIVLAEHFERGGQPARAAGWYRKAATNALEANDLPGVVSSGDRGLACGAEGHERGAILGAQAEARLRLGDNAEALRSALAAADACRRHSGDWYVALGIAVRASGRLTQTGTVHAIVDLLQEAKDRRMTAEQAAACGFAGQVWNNLGDYARCADLLGWVEARADGTVLADPAVAIGLGVARASLAISLFEVDEFKRHREHVVEVAERIGNHSVAIESRGNVAYAWLSVGQYGEAEQKLRDCVTRAEELGLRSTAAVAKQNLGLALERQGKLEEARTIETEALAELRAQGDLRFQSACQYYIATILLRAGDLDGAEREARLAVESARALPPSHAEALGTLARVLLARGGRDGEALAVARQGMQILETLGSLDEGEPLLRLVHARALHATGEVEEARTAIGASCRILFARAARITDPAWRASYLERVAENEETLELAKAWGATG
jgi:eukaryotic-like serine/threonine-protein kinase